MSVSFACPRCGSVSRSHHDAYQGYCGRCYDWTARPARYAPVSPPEHLLTPQVVLENPAWAYQGTEQDGRVTVWRFDVLRAPWVSSWRPDDALGAFEYEFTDSQLVLRVSTGVMARAAWELVHVPGSPPRAWIWEELLQAYREQAAINWAVDTESGPPVFDFATAIDWATDGAVASALGGRSVDLQGELSPEEADALENEIRRGLPDSGGRSWVSDAVQVWEGCKDAARRDRSLAELAQSVADATPQIAPSERGIDHNTAARWHPEDSGDVIL